MRAAGDQVVTEVERGKPLTGRVVLVTRAREQAGAFAELLEAAGARVLLVPTIAIEPPESWAPLDTALARATSRGSIFTSVNGVSMVRRRVVRPPGKGARSWSAPGSPPSVPPPQRRSPGGTSGRRWCRTEYVAEGLVERLRPLIAPGERVLLPRAAETRDVLVRELTALGAGGRPRCPRIAPASATRAGARTPRGAGGGPRRRRHVHQLVHRAELLRALRRGRAAAADGGSHRRVHRPDHAGHRAGAGARARGSCRRTTPSRPRPRHRGPLRSRKELAHAVPHLPPPPAPRVSAAALDGPRDDAPRRRLRLSALRGPRPRGPRAHRVHARTVPALHRRAAQGVQGRRVDGDPGGAPVRAAARQGPARHRGLRGGRHHPAGGARGEGHHPRPAGDHRRVPVRVHEPRPLRGGGGRAGEERPVARADRADRDLARRGRARTWSRPPT